MFIAREYYLNIINFVVSNALEQYFNTADYTAIWEALCKFDPGIHIGYNYLLLIALELVNRIRIVLLQYFQWSHAWC